MKQEWDGGQWIFWGIAMIVAGVLISALAVGPIGILFIAIGAILIFVGGSTATSPGDAEVISTDPFRENHDVWIRTARELVLADERGRSIALREMNEWYSRR